MNPAASRPPIDSPAPWILAPWDAGNAITVETIDPPPQSEWRDRIRVRLPVLMRGLVAEWGATRNWTFDELALRVGPRAVPVVRVHGGLLGYGKHSGMDYEMRPFDEFTRRIAGGGEPEWFLNLNPDESLPELVPDIQVPVYSRAAHWRERRITMGGAGTTTPIHRELPDNIFTVFCGQKEVVLFAPSDSRSLYGYGPFSGVPHLSEVDPRCHDAQRYPRLRDATPFRCRVRAGDALLIPRGWWHAVHTVESSIALGSWWAVGAWSLLPRAATLYKRLFGLRT